MFHCPLSQWNIIFLSLPIILHEGLQAYKMIKMNYFQQFNASTLICTFHPLLDFDVSHFLIDNCVYYCDTLFSGKNMCVITTSYMTHILSDSVAKMSQFKTYMQILRLDCCQHRQYIFVSLIFIACIPKAMISHLRQGQKSSTLPCQEDNFCIFKFNFPKQILQIRYVKLSGHLGYWQFALVIYYIDPCLFVRRPFQRNSQLLNSVCLPPPFSAQQSIFHAIYTYYNNSKIGQGHVHGPYRGDELFNYRGLCDLDLVHGICHDRSMR